MMIIPVKCCLLCFRRHGIALVLALSFVGAAFVLLLNKKGNVEIDRRQAITSLVREEFLEEGRTEREWPKIPSEAELKKRWIREKIERLSEKVRKPNAAKLLFHKPVSKPNRKVHVFYYPWYANTEHDGEWRHWNHEYLPNWRSDDPKVYPSGRHAPPQDIGSNFYPALGCYSSRDPKLIQQHMKLIAGAGIGVLVVSWYPARVKDSPEDFFGVLLDAANRHGLRVAPHLEPYDGRNAVNLLAHVNHIIDNYGNHSALHRIQSKGKNLPVFYVYDSYRIPPEEWRQVLGADGKASVRGTDRDAVFFGLLVDVDHRHQIKKARFDGFYTYFASNGFSYGSSWKNWNSLGRFAAEEGLLFAPSVGPGYVDTTVRPWNSASTRHRRHGGYYEVAWRAALTARPSLVTITSFNEWHEGTQIEPALPNPTRRTKTNALTYLDYQPEGPHFYLNLTSYWVAKYTDNQNDG